MFNRGQGGMQQVFLDYSLIFSELGYQNYGIIVPNAWIRKALEDHAVSIITLSNLGQWDFLAIFKLKAILKEIGADIVIAHGKRAITLSRYIKHIPVMAIVHDKKDIPCALLCTAVNSLVAQFREEALQLKPKANVVAIPNMLHNIPTLFKWTEFKKVPVIGALGRFFAGKGFSDFIEALSILKKKGIKFKALIGGDGPLKQEIYKQVEQNQLKDEVQFVGWVEDKEKFYKQIDLFCLPSLQETFGLVVVEAFSYGKPVVATRTSGPCEIFSHLQVSLFAEISNPNSLANMLEYAMEHPALCKKMACEGYDLVKKTYSKTIIGQKLDGFVQRLLA